jgi:hypothetical protein
MTTNMSAVRSTSEVQGVGKSVQAFENEVVKRLADEPHPAVRSVVMRRLAEIRETARRQSNEFLMAVDENADLLAAAAGRAFTLWRAAAYTKLAEAADAQSDAAGRHLSSTIELLAGDPQVNLLDIRSLAIVAVDGLRDTIQPVLESPRERLEMIAEDERAPEFLRDVAACVLKDGDAAKSLFGRIMDSNDPDYLLKLRKDEQSPKCYRFSADLRLRFLKNRAKQIRRSASQEPRHAQGH